MKNIKYEEIKNVLDYGLTIKNENGFELVKNYDNTYSIIKIGNNEVGSFVIEDKTYLISENNKMKTVYTIKELTNFEIDVFLNYE